MSNKVITTMRIDFDLLKAAQAKCAERGESVTAVCTRALEALVADDTPVAAAPAPVKRSRAKAAPPPGPAPVSPSAGPRVSAGTATAVFQPAGAEPVAGAPVPRIAKTAGDVAAQLEALPARTTDEKACPPHPKARVLKGLCGSCGRQVGSEKVA